MWLNQVVKRVIVWLWDASQFKEELGYSTVLKGTGQVSGYVASQGANYWGVRHWDH